MHLAGYKALPNQLIESILDEYDIDREVAAADVDNFIGVLRDAGALED